MAYFTSGHIHMLSAVQSMCRTGLGGLGNPCALHWPWVLAPSIVVQVLLLVFKTA